MKASKLAFLLLLIPLSSGAGTNWYQVSANTLLVADWLQTRSIANDPEYCEQNTILGEYPSQKEVDTYFITSILLVNAIGSYVLPEKYSDVFYLTVATIQGRTVLKNYSIGVRFKF